MALDLNHVVFLQYHQFVAVPITKFYRTPSIEEGPPAPPKKPNKRPRSFRTYLGSYSHQVGPSTYQNKGRNLAGNSNYGWKYDDYSGGWYQTGIVNPRK